jgi:hypothetical protein
LLALYFRRPGFGAMFAVVNMGDTDIHDVALVVSEHRFRSGSLLVGEHSMNGFHPLSRCLLPDQCEISWSDTTTNISSSSLVSLEGVPKDIRVGLLLIVRSGSHDWTVEYLPTLDLNRLRHYHEISGYNRRCAPSDRTED